MRIFKTRWFDKWATEQGLTNTVLIVAVEEIARGLVEVRLGGFVYKKRIRLPSRGKRGGARTLLAYKAQEKAFFVYGYAKNERENIDQKELEVLQELGAVLLGYTDVRLMQAIESGELKEIIKEVKQ